MNKSTQVAGLLLLGVLGGGALLLPVSGLKSVARAQAEIPRNQAEFDKFAATLDNTAPAERRAQLNRVGHAFDNGESRLFWFTDLVAARAQAKREGKPILSLRLLGNLSDEMSCANSRLFRVLLYPNGSINRQLRENFVLHWSSERPVPVVTIDMGDGRVIKRTLTGNSAHYLMDENGAVLDVLPGLYAPNEFAAWLQLDAQLAQKWRETDESARPALLKDWHRARLTEIYGGAVAASGESQQFGQTQTQKIADETRRMEQVTRQAQKAISVDSPQDLNKAKRADWTQAQVENALRNNRLAGVKTSGANAATASRLTESKMLMEMPILDAVGLRDRSIRQNGLTPAPAQIVKLDAATRVRIAATEPLLATPSQNRGAVTLSGPVLSSAFREPKEAPAYSPLDRIITDMEASVARDTQLNRLQMEVPIHAHFANGEPTDFAFLNRAIYAELFRTPASDSWLGLESVTGRGTFTALQNGGVSGVTPANTTLVTQQRVAQTP